MSIGFLEHTVAQFERWDTIAFMYYGDANEFRLIVDANPAVAADDVIAPGTVLLIPIIGAVENATLEVPPWLN